MDPIASIFVTICIFYVKYLYFYDCNISQISTNNPNNCTSLLQSVNSMYVPFFCNMCLTRLLTIASFIKFLGIKSYIPFVLSI